MEAKPRDEQLRKLGMFSLAKGRTKVDMIIVQYLRAATEKNRLNQF